MARVITYSEEFHHGKSFIELEASVVGVNLTVSSFGDNILDLSPDEFAHVVGVMVKLLMVLHPEKLLPALGEQTEFDIEEWSN